MEKDRKIKIAADVMMLSCGVILFAVQRYDLWDMWKGTAMEERQCLSVGAEAKKMWMWI